MAGPRANRQRSARRSKVGRYHRFPGAGTAIGVLACAVYLNALDNPFVYDDNFTVTRNPSIVDLGNVRYLLGYTPFRPVVNISYAIDLAIWGYHQVGFHLTNIALHAAVSILLYQLLRRLVADRRAHFGLPSDRQTDLADTWAAFVPAAIFAVHPVFTEAVAYVSGRSEVLCALFCLSSLLCARRAMLPGTPHPRARNATVGAFVCGALAFLSKEVAAALPVVLIGYDWLLLTGSSEARHRRLRRIFIPLLVVLLAGGVFRIRSLVGRDAIIAESPLLNLLTQSIVLWRYIGLLIFPVGQSIMHGTRTVVSVFDARALIAAAGLIGVAALAWRLRRRLPLVPFGVIWFFAALAPSSTIVTLWEGMAEHRVYFAAAGLSVSSLAFTLRAGRELAVHRTRLGNAYAVAFAGVMAALSCLTLIRNDVWASPIQLWAEAALAAPERWEPQYALGDSLREAGDCPAAIVHYQATLHLSPGHRDARTNLGICLAQTGRLAEAKVAFNEVLKVDPSFARAYTNLGSVAFVSGDHAAARDYYMKAISLENTNVVARMQLARVYEETFHDYRAAARLCAEVQAIAPATPGASECIQRNQKMADGKDREH
jgi:protein O-mannosyl-transferase